MRLKKLTIPMAVLFGAFLLLQRPVLALTGSVAFTGNGARSGPPCGVDAFAYAEVNITGTTDDGAGADYGALLVADSSGNHMGIWSVSAGLGNGVITIPITNINMSSMITRPITITLHDVTVINPSVSAVKATMPFASDTIDPATISILGCALRVNAVKDSITATEGDNVTNNGEVYLPYTEIASVAVFNGPGSTIGDVVWNTAANGGTWDWTYSPPDNTNGPGSILVTATDFHPAGGSDAQGSAFVNFQVFNAPPVVNAGSDFSVEAGQTFTLQATFTDPGTADTHTATVNFGAGPVAATVGQGAGSGQVSAMHTYQTTDVKDVTVCVTDDDANNNSDCDMVEITVTPATSNCVRHGDTVGIYRNSTASWYLRNYNSQGFANVIITYGLPSDQYVTGDWDGDGDDTVGIYRNNTFYLKNTNVTGNADITVAFGAPGDLPVTGDWDGDGDDTVGLYRPGSATWFLKNANLFAAPVIYQFTYGLPNEQPVSGDWNGNDRDGVGIFRFSDSKWYLRNTLTTGNNQVTPFNYGLAGTEQPLVGDWNHNCTDTIGVYRPAEGKFFLRNSNSQGFANLAFQYGLANETGISGDWDGVFAVPTTVQSHAANPQPNLTRVVPYGSPGGNSAHDNRPLVPAPANRPITDSPAERPAQGTSANRP